MINRKHAFSLTLLGLLSGLSSFAVSFWGIPGLAQATPTTAKPAVTTTTLGTSTTTTTAPAASANKVEQLKAEVRLNPKDTSKVIALAQEFYRIQDYEKATLLLWGQVEKLDRDGMILLIKSHEARKEWQESGRAAGLLVAKNEKDAVALTALGQSQFMRSKPKDKRSKEAKESLKKSIEADPKHEPAYEILDRMYEIEGNAYEGRILIQDMIDLFGPKTNYFTRLCRINMLDGENEQGEKACAQAIQKDPSIAENHVNLALIARQKNEDDRSKDLLKKAADKFPKSELAQFEYASLLEKNKNALEAYDRFEKCLLANPKSAQCHLGVGSNAVQILKYEKAYDAFRLACRHGGRKSALYVRRAALAVRKAKATAWMDKFDDLAERCQSF